MAVVAHMQGQDKRAAAMYEEALSAARNAGFNRLVAVILVDLALSALKFGASRRARVSCEEALTILRRLRDMINIAHCLNCLARVAIYEGDHAGATAYIDAAVDVSRQLDAPSPLALALMTHADLARLRGDMPAARKHCRKSLRIFMDIAEEIGVINCLESLALIEWNDGRARRALQLHGAASHQRQARGALSQRTDARHQRRMLAQARQQFSESAFQAAVSSWTGYSLQEVAAIALHR